MTTKIAINGFGRVGRTVLRRLIDSKSDLKVVAINDLADIDTLTYLYKYDTTYGRAPYKVEAIKDSLIIDDQAIEMYQEQDAKELPWSELGVDIVIESTGMYTSAEKAQAHLDAGANKVIITAPAKDETTKTIVFGVNETDLSKEDVILSAASCTTNCLAPLANALHQNFGIATGLMTTVKAYTPSQKLHDSPNEDLRRGRAAAMNAIPTTTGAAQAVGNVIPELDGVIDGTAVRVPLLGGALVEFYTNLNQKVTIDQVNQVMFEAANESFEYTDDPIVSSDILGSVAGSIFDATQTEVIEHEDSQLVKTVAWYDSEYGFVSNLVRLTEYVSRLNK